MGHAPAFVKGPGDYDVTRPSLDGPFGRLDDVIVRCKFNTDFLRELAREDLR